MLLEVSAPVADIERALQVTMRTYAHPTERRAFFAPDTEPSVAAGVADFVHCRPGQFRPAASEESAALSIEGARKSRPRGGSGPNGILAGFDYRAAYAPGVDADGNRPDGGVGGVRRLLRE